MCLPDFALCLLSSLNKSSLGVKVRIAYIGWDPMGRDRTVESGLAALLLDRIRIYGTKVQTFLSTRAFSCHVIYFAEVVGTKTTCLFSFG